MTVPDAKEPKWRLKRNFLRDSENKSFVKIDKGIEVSWDWKKHFEKWYKSPYIMTNPKFNPP